jgi:hypothetical protein
MNECTRFRSKLLLSASRGQILVLTCFALVSTLAVGGFAVDVGLLWTTRRHMQTAADAGAIAGAWDLVNSSSSSVTADAKTATSQNGFQDGSTSTTSASTVSVTVDTPPPAGSGNYASNSGAVYVKISQNQPTQFLQFAGYKSIPMTASAVAMINNSGSCIYGLNATAPKTVWISGTTSFSSACGIYDNSDNSSSALVVSGNATVSTPTIGVVGGSTYNGGPTAPMATGIAAFTDPLADVPAPSYTDTCKGSFKNTNLGSGTYSSQEWCGGITVNAGATVTFNPGLYVINGGGITFNGGTISGSNVTFYLTGQNGSGGSAKDYAGVTINGNATVNFSAPCSGASSALGNSATGILFFQDRSITSTANNGSIINGGATSTYDGALYFSTTSLNFAGSSSSNGYMYLVANSLQLTGNSTIGANYACLSGGSLIKKVALVQ